MQVLQQLLVEELAAQAAPQVATRAQMDPRHLAKVINRAEQVQADLMVQEVLAAQQPAEVQALDK